MGKTLKRGLAAALVISLLAVPAVTCFRNAKADELPDSGLNETPTYESVKEIPKKGTGVVTSLTYLRPVPNEEEEVNMPVYSLPMGTTLNVVSTKLVPSETPDSTHKYYKVSFNASEEVQDNNVDYPDYDVSGIYYIDSCYLDFTKKGQKVPEDTISGSVIKVKPGGSAYVYESKDVNSEKMGILSNDFETRLFPSESDNSWTTIWFSGQKLFVKTKYIKREYCDVTDISNLKLADVENYNLVYTWDKGVNNIDFSCKITSKYGAIEKVLYEDEHVKENKLIVTDDYLAKAEGSVEITVQANNINGNRGKKLKAKFDTGSTAPLNVRNLKAQRTSISVPFTKFEGGVVRYYGSLGSCLQISTDKKFNNAKIIEKPYKENGEKKYRQIQVIRDLKPNTTYYIRKRYRKIVSTAAGDRYVFTRWSRAVRIKTAP